MISKIYVREKHYTGPNKNKDFYYKYFKRYFFFKKCIYNKQIDFSEYLFNGDKYDI